MNAPTFTPVESSLGGILIGLSAAGALLVHGRVAGISGLFSGFFIARAQTLAIGMVHGLRDWSNVDDVKFRLMFLLGLVGGASLLAGAPGVVLLAGGASPVTVALGLPLWRYAVAGLLVGAGTKVGHGCTSGHGVCGLGRLSVRSIVNVLAFLVTGIVVASFIFTSGDLGVAPTTVPERGGDYAWQAVLVSVLPLIVVALAVKFDQPRVSHLTLGAVFGFGLTVSGMSEPSKVIGFLNVRSGRWDPSLMCVLGGAVFVSFLSYRVKSKVSAPLLDVKFFVPSNTRLEWRLVVGGVLFGLGWAVAGFCPGPVVANLFQLGFVAPTWLACMLIGGIVAQAAEHAIANLSARSVASPAPIMSASDSAAFDSASSETTTH
jgi:uncharacterized membrane protein YedE/YeeE